MTIHNIEKYVASLQNIHENLERTAEIPFPSLLYLSKSEEINNWLCIFT